jgi:hypothetical protein
MNETDAKPPAAFRPEAALDAAAQDYLAARNRLMAALERVGRMIQLGLVRLPPGAEEQVATAAREALGLAWRVAVTGLEREARPESATAYRLGGALTGALGGFGGFATTLAELPVTTTLIMRSVADIARARGLDLEDLAVREACIEVFAFGGPLEEDDDQDLAFWTARLAGQEVAQLIAAVVARYAPAALAKLAGQAVPFVGAAVGAGLNLAYMEFYQRMARVVFTLLPMEAAQGRASTRRAFAAAVDARRAARGEDARFGRRLAPTSGRSS